MLLRVVIWSTSSTVDSNYWFCYRDRNRGYPAGAAIVTYSVGAGCSKTATVTVNPVITGAPALCVGMSITLSDGVAGGAGEVAVTVRLPLPGKYWCCYGNRTRHSDYTAHMAFRFRR